MFLLKLVWENPNGSKTIGDSMAFYTSIDRYCIGLSNKPKIISLDHTGAEIGWLLST